MEQQSNSEFEINTNSYLNTNNSYLPTITEKGRKNILESNKKKELIRLSLKRIEDMIPKKIGSIFNKKRINPRKIFNFKNPTLPEEFSSRKSNVHEINRYNIYTNEDKYLNELILKFKEKSKKDKISKLVRKKMVFNRLYDVEDSSIFNLKKIKNRKNLYTLEKYQENILKTIDVKSVEPTEVMNLIYNFKQLKNDSEDVKALPPININKIKNHVLNNKSIDIKKKSIKDILGKDIKPLDEFEQEEKSINMLRAHKSNIKSKRNRNFDKLPEYLREALTENLNYH